MAEFKKLSEVEQIETASDNATVLVEEGGEIKRVAKSEVGGKAGGMVVVVEADKASYIGQGNIVYGYSDNYDAIYECILAGGSVWLDASVLYQNYKAAFAKVITAMLTEDGLVLCVLGEYGTTGILFPNGSYHST